MYYYDTIALQWSLVLPFKAPPSPRSAFGFTSTAGKLYVFGGLTITGIFLLVSLFSCESLDGS